MKTLKKCSIILFVLALVIPALALGTASAQGSVEVVYWSMWNEDEAQGQVIKQAVSDFEAANPSIKVRVVWNGRENRNLVGPAIEAGETIDVFDTGMDLIISNLAQYIIPLDDYLTLPAIGGEAGATVADVLSPALLNQYPVDGHLAMIPYSPFAVMWFYNRDHFDDAGITEAPATWEDFMAVNAALKAAGHAPITTDVDAYLDIIIGYYAERAVGCDGLQAAMADKTGEAWNNPMWLQMAQDIRALWDNGYIAEGTEANLYPFGQQSLALGEVTMYLNGTWLPSEVLSTTGPDFHWGAFAFPSVEGGAGANTHIMTGSQGLVITTVSQHPDEAFEFIRFMVSKDVQEVWTLETLTPAARVDVGWAGAIAPAGEVFSQADMGIGWACDLWAGGEIVANVVLPNFQDLFVGKLSPAEYVEKMANDSAAFWASRED
jgi:raffinose/stachyose/melibiose transport system substrate-binding protein